MKDPSRSSSNLDPYVKAESMEWKSDEIERKRLYDAKAAASKKDVDSTPWNPPLGEDGKPLDDSLRQKYKDLWKM